MIVLYQTCPIIGDHYQSFVINIYFRTYSSVIIVGISFIAVRVFVVEIQGVRGHQTREMLVTVESLQASDAGKSQRRMRRRKKRSRKSGDAVRNDVDSEECSTEMQVSMNRLAQSHQADVVQPVFAGIGESYEYQPYDDSEDVELPEVKRYPAYHYDSYGTIYSLTDGVRPSTLERNTVKSASADCLDIHSITAQPAERQASVDEVNKSVARAPAVKPKPPPKPLPRRKPRATDTTLPSEDTSTQSAALPASMDAAFVTALSSVLKQRNP